MRARKKQNRNDMIEIVKNPIDSPNVNETSVNHSRIDNKEEKLVTKYQQTGNKQITKPITKYQQTGNKPVTKTENKFVPKTETSNKLPTKLATEVITKYQQTDNKPVTKTSFKQLSGLQKKLTEVIYSSCRENGNKVSHPLSINYLAEISQSTIGSIKMSTRRLVKKGVISKENFKNGRGGWTEYRISNEIYSEVLFQQTDNKLITNHQQTSNKLPTKLVTKLVTNDSSSNSNTLNTITTNKILEQIQTPQNLKSLGFGIGHIKQLKEKFHLSIDEIQKNLESFAYDLDNGELERLKGRGIQNIIGYFFGAIKSGGYNSIINGFIPAEELAEQEMLERLERKKTERKEREIKLKELLFEEWLETKTKDDLVKINPPMINYMDSFHKAALKGYFVDNELEKFKQDFH